LRETVQKVGYEGGEQYLGGWRPVLERECASLGWSFYVNPPELADLDIVVALRQQTGYAVRTWKSGVKLANAQGSGTPIICNRTAGYCTYGYPYPERGEQGGAVFADSYNDIRWAFDVLRPIDRRRDAAARLRRDVPTLENAAVVYREWLSRLC
jgi:hypothetical protein